MSTAVQQKGGEGGPDVADRLLLAELRRGQLSALSRLYDRYSALVFTLACHSLPAEAETITEEVFAELWRGRQSGAATAPVLATLIRLTGERVACRELRGGRGRALGAAPETPAALAPFAGLAPLPFDVVVLAAVGQLSTAEIAVALDVDRDAVSRALTAAFASLRAARLQTGDGLAEA